MLNHWPYAGDWFPDWLRRPAARELVQHTLFPDDLEAVLAQLQISRDELARWHARGWVSFAPHGGTIEVEHGYEIRFVRDIVRSGLQDAQVERLLEQLPRPINFDPAVVAYNFSLGWIEAGPPSEPDVNEFMEEHLDEWLAEMAGEDVDRLSELRGRLDALIAGCMDGDSESDATGGSPGEGQA